MTSLIAEPDRRPLPDPPLALVAAQIDFAQSERSLPNKEIFRFRDAVNRNSGGAYGELTQIRKNQISVQIGALGPSTTSEPTSSLGWRLAVRDQSLSLSVFADSITLESRTYGGWAAAFRPRLQDAIIAAFEVFAPDVETRLGLRYVNALSHNDATSPTYWRDKIQPAFLGPLGDDQLAAAFQASAGRASLAFDGVSANVGIAFQPDAALPGRTAAIFDIDVFRQGAREFTIDSALSGADLLNTTALQIFQSILARSFFEGLGRTR
jgi:uncharacterized protein (TIGR04255 family)